MGRDRRYSGFTLIELVLVLLVIAVAAAIAAPSLSGFARGRALPNTATDLVTTANWCRYKALSDGKEYRLNLDQNSGTWWVTKDNNDGTFADVTEELGRQFTLPQGLQIRDVQIASAPDAKTDQGIYVSFRPGGKADVSRITLANDVTTIVVACDSPLAGFHIVQGTTP